MVLTDDHPRYSSPLLPATVLPGSTFTALSSLIIFFIVSFTSLHKPKNLTQSNDNSYPAYDLMKK